VGDAIKILRMVVGLDPYDPQADANQNGSADVGDAILVLRCVVDLEDWPIGVMPSPERIAFCSDRDGNWEIYVMNADGTGQTRLTNNPLPDLEPAWSPDGTKIAFVRGNPESWPSGFEDWDIWVMNADGTGQTQLTSSIRHESGPTWSPDGTKIAFTKGIPGEDEPCEIWVMNSDGSGQTALIGNPSWNDVWPAWWGPAP